MNTCELCGHTTKTMFAVCAVPIYFCKKCRHYYCGTLPVSMSYSVYDTYEDSLKALRIKNFNKILKKIRPLIPEGAIGFEVGSALGWFLQQGTKAGYSLVGIEPMEFNWQKAKKSGHSVIHGYFPQDIPDSYQGSFDFIIFNDVFEHIPHPLQVLTSCRSLLKNTSCGGGYLIINLPQNTGLLYKIAFALAKFGRSGSMQRLWQFETESPHLHYFSRQSLQRAASEAGFRQITAFPLATLTFDAKSTYKRISGIGKTNKIKVFVLAVAMLLTVPLMKLLPKDIKCYIFRKEGHL